MEFHRLMSPVKMEFVQRADGQKVLSIFSTTVGFGITEAVDELK